MKSVDSESESARLHAAIERVCAADSHYWYFRESNGLNLSDNHEIEVRLNIDPAAVSTFVIPSGWRIAHTKPDDGIVFLRRKQPLTNEALRAMFADVLSIAMAHRAQFHSWMHAPDLPNWQTET